MIQITSYTFLFFNLILFATNVAISLIDRLNFENIDKFSGTIFITNQMLKSVALIGMFATIYFKNNFVVSKLDKEALEQIIFTWGTVVLVWLLTSIIKHLRFVIKNFIYNVKLINEARDVYVNNKKGDDDTNV